MPLSKIQDIDNQVIPNLGRRNLVINGAMRVAQRGTSETGKTTGGYYTVDRYRTDHNGFTGSYTQDTDVPSGYGFSNSLKIQVTSAASSDAGTLRLDTRIEAQDLRNSGWDYTSSSSYATFSCWVKSSLAGTYYFGFRTDDGTSRQYTKAFTLVANTWKKIEISMPGDSSITFDNDKEMGALIALHIDERTAQSDSGHTVDGWQNYSGTSRTPDFSQNWSETLNATFHTTGWQLEVGDSASEFEHRSFGEELALCERYFQKTYNYGSYLTANADLGAVGYYATNDSDAMNVNFTSPMRTGPTLSIQRKNGGGANQAQRGNNSGTYATLTNVSATDKGFQFDQDYTNDAYFRFHYYADAEL